MNSEFLQPTLKGETIALFPLELEHFDDLFDAASDPLLWEGHPSKSRYQKVEFTKWFEDAMNSGGALVVRHNQSNRLIGSSRFYEPNENGSDVSIGFTFLAREFWGGATNREMKSLMLSHAFERVNTVWFHVDISNIRSQMALLRIGAINSHIAEKCFNDRSSKYVFFKIEK